MPGERRALALSRLGAMTALDVILLASPGEEVKRRPLSPSVTTIGRSATSSVLIDDTYISPAQAVIEKRNGFYYVRAVSVTSGTWLNGKKLQPGPDGEAELHYDDV